MHSETASASTTRLLPVQMVQGSLRHSLSLSSLTHKHTADYMLLFIIHVAFLPLLESVQKKKNKEAMKREMANVYCSRSVLGKEISY